MMSYWLENAASLARRQDPDDMSAAEHVLVDLGYVKDKGTRDNADQLRTMLGKRNFELVYCGRLLVRIPPTKVDKILAAFPKIKARCSYSWCTHSWLPDDYKPLG